MNLHYQPVLELLEHVSNDIILRHYQNLKAAEIEEKSPGDLVTIADKLSEAALTEGLGKILPDAAIVGEEAVAATPGIMKKLEDDQVWIIDPIDGTGNFAAGKAPFGIIIALAANGKTVAGWLYDPLSKRICHAARGQGAYINGEKDLPPPPKFRRKPDCSSCHRFYDRGTAKSHSGSSHTGI